MNIEKRIDNFDAVIDSLEDEIKTLNEKKSKILKEYREYMALVRECSTFKAEVIGKIITDLIFIFEGGTYQYKVDQILGVNIEYDTFNGRIINEYHIPTVTNILKIYSDTPQLSSLEKDKFVRNFSIFIPKDSCYKIYGLSPTGFPYDVRCLFAQFPYIEEFYKKVINYRMSKKEQYPDQSSAITMDELEVLEKQFLKEKVDDSFKKQQLQLKK